MRNGPARGWLRVVATLALALALFAVLPSAFLAPARAETPDSAVALKVGVIDMQRILRESISGKSVVKQREQFLNAYQAEAAKQEKELRDADQELARQRTLLSGDAFTEKQNALRKRFSEFQHSVEVRRRGVEKVTTEALEEVDSKLIEVTQALAKDRGLTLILHQTQLFMFDSKFDITEPAMERLNKILPKITLKDPLKAGAAATPTGN
ncbi:MAG: OmpH family outer membrane protein [Alphaproteobacteria bacterium]